MTANWPATRTDLPHPDRVAAWSGSLALNALVLGALLLPLSQTIDLPERIRPKDEPIEGRIVPREVVQPVPPIPQAPRLPLRVERRPTPPVQAPPDEAPVFQQAAVSIPVNVPETTVPVEPVDNAGPVQLAVGALAYDYAPQPRYPGIAVRKRWEGVVLLRVLVGEDGSPLKVTIERSSGRPILDTTARDKVANEWRFRPAMRDGNPVQAWGLIPISFSLTEG